MRENPVIAEVLKKVMNYSPENLSLTFDTPPLFLTSQPQAYLDNTPPPDCNALPTLNQIDRDMYVCLMLSKNQSLEIKKINARYMGRVRDILTYESGQEKNTDLMMAWDNWAKSLEGILTEKQFNRFLSWNHNALWERQEGQV